jgi:hypothetical protein
MVTCQIMLHEGVVDEDLRPALEAGIRRIYGDVVGILPADLEVEYVDVPAGRWFTAGVISRNSSVHATVPAGFDSDARTKLLTEIYDHWRATTGCTPNEIVVVAVDEVST